MLANKNYSGQIAQAERQRLAQEAATREQAERQRVAQEVAAQERAERQCIEQEASVERQRVVTVNPFIDVWVNQNETSIKKCLYC